MSSSDAAPVAGPSSSASRSNSYAEGKSQAHLQQHCSFVLQAEFDIDRGSTLSHVYPNEDVIAGHDHHTLAELMLPDGVHARAEDWTVFLLHNKNPQGSNASDPVYVLNMVRTKHDTSVRRGAFVRAMAIGTQHACMQVFKPLLQLALDDFFQSPGPAASAKLFEAINSIDLSLAPTFSRAEKLILRSTERRDFFSSRYSSGPPTTAPLTSQRSALRQDNPLQQQQAAASQAMSRKPSSASTRSRLLTRGGSDGGTSLANSLASPLPAPDPTAKDTHVFETVAKYGQLDRSIRWPLDEWSDEIGEYSLSTLFQTFASQPVSGPLHAHLHSNGAQTHPIVLLFNAIITYKRVLFLGHNLPAATVANHVLAAAALGSGCGAVIPGLKERVSPYANLMSLDTLEETPGFIAGVTNPRFEELKCWDVLFNIETGKITVSKHIEPALPTNLSLGNASGSSWSSSGGIGSVNGSMGLSNDGNPVSPGADGSESVHFPFSDTPVSSTGSSFRGKGSSAFRGHRAAGSLVSEFGTLTTGVSEARSDSADTLFMEDLAGCVTARYSETYVRARIYDYVAYFARHVAKHDEQCHGSTVTNGLRRYAHQPYLNGQIGSGNSFGDREGELRELAANAGRVEGFRSTPGYKLLLEHEAMRQAESTVADLDLWHQVTRLRGRGKAVSSAEAGLIYSSFVKSVQTEEQIAELLAVLPLYSGGLTPVAMGLFHTSRTVRTAAAQILARVASHRDAGLKYIQALPLYHRLAFARLQHESAENAAVAAAAAAAATPPSASAPGFVALSQQRSRAMQSTGDGTNPGSNLLLRRAVSPSPLGVLSSSVPMTKNSASAGGDSSVPGSDGLPVAASTFLDGATASRQVSRNHAAALDHGDAVDAGSSDIGKMPQQQNNSIHNNNTSTITSSLSAAFEELNLTNTSTNVNEGAQLGHGADDSFNSEEEEHLAESTVDSSSAEDRSMS